MATTIKVIDNWKDAVPYSEMGLLCMKYHTGEWFHDDDVGYWTRWSDPQGKWRSQQGAGILYGIMLEE